MTERLSALLHDEADAIVIPHAPTDEVLKKGHGLRWRRRATHGLVALAVLGAVGTGAALVADRDGTGVTTLDPAAAYLERGALSVGNTLYVGNTEVQFPEAIKAIYYSSAGVLVRSGAEAETDTPGPSHYTLVQPDGTKSPVDVTMGDRVPDTDPDSPNLAYAEPNGDRWDLVLHDLRTNEEVGRRTVEGSFTWGGWEAPPVAISGDRVWAHFDNGWTEWDTATDDVARVPDTLRVSEIGGSHYLSQTADQWVARRVDDRSQVSTIPATEAMYGVLSPDGRYLKWFDQMSDEPSAGFQVVDVVSGDSVDFRGDAFRYGWTPDGHLLQHDAKSGAVSICDPETATCDPTGVVAKGGRDAVVKLGGLAYES